MKQYRGRTIISKYPEKSSKKPTAEQKKNRERFKRAVAYATKVMNDQELYHNYEKKLKKGQSVFQCAISDYMKRMREEENAIELQVPIHSRRKTKKTKGK